MESLYTVIVNWNLKDDILACISSLLAAGGSLDMMIVVDNHSTDGSVTALRKEYGDRLKLIECEENLGYAGGLYPGITLALEKGAQWLLILNNDVIVDRSFYEELKRAIQQNPEYSIFGPLIMEYYHPDRVWFLGDRLIPGLLFTQSLARGKVDTSQFQEVVPVDFITGCAMLVKRQVFDKIGYYSTQYFMYAEDIDFCWRARTAGFRLASVPKAKMWHKISEGSRQDHPLNRYWRTYNQIIFYRKYAHFYQIPFLTGLSLFRAILIGCKDLWLRQPELIPPLVKGWLEGWFLPNLRKFND